VITPESRHHPPASLHACCRAIGCAWSLGCASPPLPRHCHATVCQPACTWVCPIPKRPCKQQAEEAGEPRPSAQDALSIADEIRKEEKQKDGLTFYDFDIDSPVRTRGRVEAGAREWVGCPAGDLSVFKSYSKFESKSYYYGSSRVVPPCALCSVRTPSPPAPQPPPCAPCGVQTPAPSPPAPPRPSQVNRYLASISVKLGKVYALFVKSPANVSVRACGVHRRGGGGGALQQCHRCVGVHPSSCSPRSRRQRQHQQYSAQQWGQLSNAQQLLSNGASCHLPARATTCALNTPAPRPRHRTSRRTRESCATSSTPSSASRGWPGGESSVLASWPPATAAISSQQGGMWEGLWRAGGLALEHTLPPFPRRKNTRRLIDAGYGIGGGPE